MKQTKTTPPRSSRRPCFDWVGWRSNLRLRRRSGLQNKLEMDSNAFPVGSRGWWEMKRIEGGGRVR